MTLCYYITGHGFGHAVRTTQILRALPDRVRLIVKTTVPERLLREELPGRDFTYVRAEYDCGCLQRDSVTVLPRETLARYREIAAQNEARLADEVASLRRARVRCVVTDIPSFPLRAARAAGVPGVAVANFTWHDIYRDYVRTPQDAALLDQIAAEYAAASVALITPLSLPSVADPFSRAERVPLVARRGRNVREALGQKLGIVGRHLALLYLGNWGLNVPWEALAGLQDWVFLTYEAPAMSAANVRTLDRQDWPYADVAASVDAVLSKPGYGTVTECIANGVPFVYVPRAGFAEYEALVAGMAPWRGGVPLGTRDFTDGNWRAALDAALTATLDPNAYATDGAAVIAEKLMETLMRYAA